MFYVGSDFYYITCLLYTSRMAKVTARLQLEDNVYDYLKFSFDFKSDEVNKLSLIHI